MKNELYFNHVITTTAMLELSEAEMGALDALAGYGTDPFLKSFYKEMGEAYLRPYEPGLRSLFERIKSTVPSALRDVKDARVALIEKRQKNAQAIEARRAAATKIDAVHEHAVPEGNAP